MAGSRGIKCSWIDLKRKRQALQALEKGDAEKYAELRCVDNSTVKNWRRSLEVLGIMEDTEMELAPLEHVQPTHGQRIAEEFRKYEKPPWSKETKTKIIECVEHCEDEKLTAKQIKEHAKQVVKSMLAVRDGEPSRLPIPRVKPGEWWQLGDHLLFCGDTSQPEFHEKVPEVAFAFADPPYNAKVASWDEGFVWDHDWLAGKTGIVAVTPGISAIQHFMRRTDMPYQWSMACWISNGGARGALGFGNWIYIALFGMGKLYRNAQDFLQITLDPSEADDTKHKGRKPLGMMGPLLRLFTKKGETVVDPFLGSGSTIIAAESTGRKCIGGELNPTFCRDIIGRWQDKTERAAERFQEE